MINKPLSKDEYTKVFYKQLIEEGFDESDDILVNLSTHLWFNPTRCGFRLSFSGYKIISNFLECAEFKLEDEWNVNLLLINLEKFMEGPYYIHPAKENSTITQCYKKITVFSSEESFSIAMTGSLEQYLLDIKNNISVKNNNLT